MKVPEQDKDRPRDCYNHITIKTVHVQQHTVASTTQFTVDASRFDDRFSVHGSRFTVHGSWHLIITNIGGSEEQVQVQVQVLSI